MGSLPDVRPGARCSASPAGTAGDAEHFRAIEIYGGVVHHELRGVAHFVARVPIDGEGRTALAWVEICPGVGGVVVTRQVAGTIGWESVGFVEGREDAAILAYMRSEAGLDWRVLPVATGHVGVRARSGRLFSPAAG